MKPEARSLDDALMGRALRAAVRASLRGEVPIGAVVHRAGEILGVGSNTSIRSKDPSGHAEIVALRRAARAAGNHRLPGATLYVTLEPCLMCLGAMIQARIARLVFAAPDPKVGATALLVESKRAGGLNHRFRIEGGLRGEEAAALLRSFFSQRRSARSRPGAPKQKSRHRAS